MSPRHREGFRLADIYEYAEKVYKLGCQNRQAADEAVAADVDAEIESELKELRQPLEKDLFLSVKLDTPCCQSIFVSNEALV